VDFMHNSIQDIYNVWAHPAGPWSGWVKPVLFAHLSEHRSETGIETMKKLVNDTDVSWAPSKNKNTAIVIDLPGANSLRIALALASRGYQPIPLYNCAPDPRGIIDLQAVMSLLANGHKFLEELPAPADAPPAFILDNRRLKGYAEPGRYDNRWVILPQDFPSSGMLLQHDLRAVMVVQEQQGQPAEDLGHVLKRWQDSGIEIKVLSITHPSSAMKMQITTPWHFRSFLYRTLVLLGLRRNSAGGFGALVPEPSSGGGFS
jgi:hypothetical protein